MRGLLEYTGFFIANRLTARSQEVPRWHFNVSPRRTPKRWRPVRDLNALLFPETCAACLDRPGSSMDFFCGRCASSLSQPDPERLRALCPLFAPGIAQLWSLWYTEPDSPARRAIHAVKYRYAPGLAAWMGAKAASSIPAGSAFDAVVPVPLHRVRQRERGFNQAEQVAMGVSRQLGVPLKAALVRAVGGHSQTKRSSVRRRDLDRGTFSAMGPVPASRILLVDDVVTTGTTMNTAARALLDAGADEVCGLSVAVSRRPGAP